MKSMTLFAALVSVALVGSVLGRSPPVVSIPENCVFLTNTQTPSGGEYSYIDPLGSLITITYQIGANGDYSESRKVVLDYASGHSSSGAQHSSVVAVQVINEIEIQIATTIQEVLQATDVNAPNFRPNNLVQVIVSKLRPIIRTTVQRIISESRLSLNVDEVAENVIAQIQPSILEGIEIAIQGSSSSIIGVNRPGAKPAGVLSGQGETSALLIDQLIARLRPIIVQIVNQQTKIQCQNHSGGSSVSTSSTGFVSGSTSFGSSSGSTSSSGFGSSATSFGSSGSSSSGSFGGRPSTSSGSSSGSTSSSGFVSTTSTFGSSAVAPSTSYGTSGFVPSSTYESGSSGSVTSSSSRPIQPTKKPISSVDIDVLTNELVEIIVEMLKDDIQIAVLNEIRAHSQNDYQVLADAILSTLRPSIIKVIQTTVNSNSKFAGFKSDIESLTTRILNKLRPIILESIKSGFQKVREEEAKNAQLAQTQLIDAVISQIQGKLEAEVRVVIESYSGSLAAANKESLINAVIQRLRPIILSILQSLQQSDSRFSSVSSSSFNSFVDQIIDRLRPLILQFIEEAFSSVALEGQLIEIVVSQVRGQIEVLVTEEIRGSSGSFNQQQLLNAIINRLRPIILSQFQNIQRSDSRFTSFSSFKFDGLVEQVIQRLRSYILELIENALQTLSLQDSLIEELISIAIGQLDGEIQNLVISELKGLRDLNNVNEQRILQAVISKMTPLIRQTILSIFQTQSRFAVLSSQIDLIIQRIIDALRSIILDAIRFNIEVLRKESVKVVTQPPTKTQQITNLFGISGENNVKVETPKFNYQYAIDFSRRR